MSSTSMYIIAGIGYLVLMLVSFLVLRGVCSHHGKPAIEPPPPPPRQEDTPSVKYLKERVAQLEQKDVQRKLFLELNKVLSTAATFDDLARGCIEAICDKLGASSAAILWKSAEYDSLLFKYGRGYGDTSDFQLPMRASIAGSALMKREPVFLAKPRQEVLYVPIPGVNESNVLCAPVRLFKDYRAVLRVANIDTNIISSAEVVSTFGLLTPLLSSALEKVLISQQSEKRKNELAAISGITQTLNKTLDLREICAACARHLKPIFNYTYFTITRFEEGDKLATLVAIPREIKFNDSEASSHIILRNLCTKKEPIVIENLHRSSNFKCQNRDVGSLMSMPVVIAGEPFGAIVVTTGIDTPFDSDDLNALSAISEHMAVTMERAIYFKKQEDQATRDGLTGLHNHRSFQERMRFELDRYNRYKRPFSLVMLDIDHFKKFNDTYGHQTGDLVLKAVAGVMRGAIRTTDIAFRYGGEEMCVLLPETELDPAALFAGRLLTALRNNSVPSTFGNLKVTASLGVAMASALANTPEAIVEAADKCLYFGKENGRNCVSVSRNGVPELYKMPV